MAVRDVDKGFKKLMATMRKVDSRPEREITVGVHSDEGGNYEGASIQDVATFHEFGTATIPARSFVRAWFDTTESENNAKIGRALEQGIKTGDFDQPLKQLATVFAADVQKRIIGGIPPPLVSRSGTPLVDTGQLKSAIAAKLDGTKV